MRSAGKSIKGEFKRSEFKREVPLSVHTNSSLPGKQEFLKLISLTTFDGEYFE